MLTCQWLRRIWTPCGNRRSSHGDSLYLSKATKHRNGGPQATKKDIELWQYRAFYNILNGLFIGKGSCSGVLDIFGFEILAWRRKVCFILVQLYYYHQQLIFTASSNTSTHNDVIAILWGTGWGDVAVCHYILKWVKILLNIMVVITWYVGASC